MRDDNIIISGPPQVVAFQVPVDEVLGVKVVKGEREGQDYSIKVWPRLIYLFNSFFKEFLKPKVLLFLYGLPQGFIKLIAMQFWGFIIFAMTFWGRFENQSA